MARSLDKKGRLVDSTTRNLYCDVMLTRTGATNFPCSQLLNSLLSWTGLETNCIVCYLLGSKPPQTLTHIHAPAQATGKVNKVGSLVQPLRNDTLPVRRLEIHQRHTFRPSSSEDVISDAVFVIHAR